MKYLVFLINLLSYTVFFTTNFLLGVQYTGSVGNSSLVVFILGCNILTFYYIVKELLLGKYKKISKKEFIVYIVAIFLIFLYFIENCESKLTKIVLFHGYISFSFPAIFMGVNLAKQKMLSKLGKYMDIVMIYLTVGLVLLLPVVLLGKKMNLGGVTYQEISYYAAFTYSINLLFLLQGFKNSRFKITQNNVYKIISCIILIVQVLISLMSGGRGGFVLIVVSSLVIPYYCINIKKLKFKNIFKLIIVFLILFFIAQLFIPQFRENIEKGSSRVFSYVSADGIDMSETSGRDVVFKQAISFINDSPIIGYGFYRYFDFINRYPHNFFLEILLQGGMLLLLISVVFLFGIYRKFNRIVKIDKDNLILLPFILFAFVQLMFSNSYVQMSLFWFFISYIYTYNSSKI